MGKRKIVRERHSSMHAQLVDLVRNHPRLWSKDKCSAEGETIWDGIADEMGVQKTFLQQTWNRLRNEYFLAMEKGANRTDSPPAEDLSFLKHSMDRSSKRAVSVTQDDGEIEDEFVITADQIDESSDEKIIPIEFDESEADQMFFARDGDSGDDVSPKEAETETGWTNRRMPLHWKAETTAPANEDNRTEDQIFGEFVSAMLAKMQPDDKKRAKKEIMNILL